MTTLIQDAFKAIGEKLLSRRQVTLSRLTFDRTAIAKYTSSSTHRGYSLGRGARRQAEAASPGFGCLRLAIADSWTVLVRPRRTTLVRRFAAFRYSDTDRSRRDGGVKASDRAAESRSERV